MPDYIAQLCARCDGLGYMHRDEKGTAYPVTLDDDAHGCTLPGIEPCIACERCPDCGRDGLGPGVAWGALRRPWGREAAEAVIRLVDGPEWRDRLDDEEAAAVVARAIRILDVALDAQLMAMEAKSDA